MPKFHQGKYTLKNPSKYVGTFPIIYRSSWELRVMNFFDKHPNILKWASESIQIPYVSPLTNKVTVYIPDFFISHLDKNGKLHNTLVEVKPIKQVTVESIDNKRRRVSKNARMVVALNEHKWKAARAYCKRYNLEFEVWTEKDLFRQPNL